MEGYPSLVSSFLSYWRPFGLNTHKPWTLLSRQTRSICAPVFIPPQRESEAAHSCPTLRDPMDCNLPGSSVHGIFQARALGWVAISFSTWSNPGIEPRSPTLQADALPSEPPRKPQSESRSVSWFCDPKDCTVHGILQASILEWVVFLFSRGSSQPRDRTQVSYFAGRFFTSWATASPPKLKKKKKSCLS